MKVGDHPKGAERKAHRSQAWCRSESFREARYLRHHSPASASSRPYACQPKSKSGQQSGFRNHESQISRHHSPTSASSRPYSCK